MTITKLKNKPYYLASISQQVVNNAEYLNYTNFKHFIAPTRMQAINKALAYVYN